MPSDRDQPHLATEKELRRDPLLVAGLFTLTGKLLSQNYEFISSLLAPGNTVLHDFTSIVRSVLSSRSDEYKSADAQLYLSAYFFNEDLALASDDFAGMVRFVCENIYDHGVNSGIASGRYGKLSYQLTWPRVLRDTRDVREDRSQAPQSQEDAKPEAPKEHVLPALSLTALDVDSLQSQTQSLAQSYEDWFAEHDIEGAARLPFLKPLLQLLPNEALHPPQTQSRTIGEIEQQRDEQFAAATRVEVFGNAAPSVDAFRKFLTSLRRNTPESTTFAEKARVCEVINFWVEHLPESAQLTFEGAACNLTAVKTSGNGLFRVRETGAEQKPLHQRAKFPALSVRKTKHIRPAR